MVVQHPLQLERCVVRHDAIDVIEAGEPVAAFLF